MAAVVVVGVEDLDLQRQSEDSEEHLSNKGDAILPGEIADVVDGGEAPSHLEREREREKGRERGQSNAERDTKRERWEVLTSKTCLRIGMMKYIASMPRKTPRGEPSSGSFRMP